MWSHVRMSAGPVPWSQLSLILRLPAHATRHLAGQEHLPPPATMKVPRPLCLLSRAAAGSRQVTPSVCPLAGLCAGPAPASQAAPAPSWLAPGPFPLAARTRSRMRAQAAAAPAPAPRRRRVPRFRLPAAWFRSGSLAASVASIPLLPTAFPPGAINRSERAPGQCDVHRPATGHCLLMAGKAGEHPGITRRHPFTPPRGNRPGQEPYPARYGTMTATHRRASGPADLRRAGLADGLGESPGQPFPAIYTQDRECRIPALGIAVRQTRRRRGRADGSAEIKRHRTPPASVCIAPGCRAAATCP